MRYSQTKPFENREHILWEIGYCGKAGEYFTILGLVFAALGIIGDLLNMKLGLGSTSWLLLAIAFVVGSMSPHMHAIMAKQLLGMEVIKKDRNS
jgi:hypothetical protein